MDRGLTRRGLIAALVAGGAGAGALSGVGDFLDAAAPLSGRIWRESGPAPETVESEYGMATVTYDDDHVPHVEAESEAAAYFAVGYAQAADRLVQMDLLRRSAEGSLSEIVGPSAVEQDVFRTKMDFRGAAEAAVEAIEGTEAARVTRAYADGINAYVDAGPNGMEYGILGAEPRAWRLRDTMLVVLQMGWLLNGGFTPLVESVKRASFDAETRRALYPDRLDHGAPIIRTGRTGGDERGIERTATRSGPPAGETQSVEPAFADWLDRFGGPDWAGSNCWTVSGEHTDSGRPILCSDPHLMLNVPPIWYQQRIRTPEIDLRGVAVPGTPFVPIGENEHCAWGITNVGANAVDCYTYETDGDRYRYRGEWREFETETRTVAVDGGDDREVTVRKTVHGPYIEREIGGETHHVGVSWVGLGGVRDAVGIHGISRADGPAAFRESLRSVDVVIQNFHYADRDGNTLYQLGGSLPIRRIDGAVVRRDRVFDGSAGEAEWAGFEPYGRSSWEGFVPAEELPGVSNPDYVASANQRTADDPAYPIAESFAPGFRGRRIYEVLDEATAEGTVNIADMQALQLDSVSVPARMLVPAILDERERMPAAADPWLDALADWDYRMERDSRAALVFVLLAEYYPEELWSDFFDERDLSARFWPSPWTAVRAAIEDHDLPVDPGDALVAATERAVEEIEAEGWETYGDYNVTGFDHPFGFLLPGLNYERHPTDGGPTTVRRFNAAGPDGASYRFVTEPGGPSYDVLPGGNDGSALSDDYESQLPLWADGEYRELGDGPDGDPDLRIEEVDR